MRIAVLSIVAGTALWLAFGAEAGRCCAAVTVERKADMVERRAFDPAHPPADMPLLGPREAAVTHSRYDCALKLAYEVREEKKDGNGCTTVLHVQNVTVMLRLTITIWLPRGAPVRLAAHEEGHKRIEQRVYGEADDVARSLAKGIDGSELTGEAASCAEQQAANAAANQFCRAYLDRIAGRAASINEDYDRLTAHGTRNPPTPDEAIRLAFAQAERPIGAASATRPASRPVSGR